MAKALLPEIGTWATVVTAGRQGCDLKMDLTDASTIKVPEGIDAVLHAASYFGGKNAEDQRLAQLVNVQGTKLLYEASTIAGVKYFVFISSIFSWLKKGSPFYSYYSQSKRDAEVELAKYERATTVCVIRPSQLYGDDDACRKHQPFFYRIADMAMRGEAIQLFGRRDPLRNYLHIKDLCHVISCVLKQRLPGSFDCQFPVDVTYSEVARAACEAFGSKADITFMKHEADIADNVFEKKMELYALIGFTPGIGISEGMNRIARYRKAKA